MRLLAIALVLLVGFVIAEIAVAVAASSLALLADAGHLATDVLALVMAITAARFARRPVAGPWTFGFGRAEVLSASVNGVTLLVAAGVVLVEAIRRLVHPASVDGAPVIVVASIGLVVNIAATLVLSRADRSSMNIAGAIAHVATDAYAFAAALVAGIVVLATGYDRADPLASLVVVVLMLWSARSLLMRSGAVLLERAPDGVDLVVLQQHLLGNDHVVAVHDLHAWTVGAGLPAVSAHVVVDDHCFEAGHAPRLLDTLQQCLAGHFDVEHSTFQLEPAGHTDHEPGTH